MRTDDLDREVEPVDLRLILRGLAYGFLCVVPLWAFLVACIYGGWALAHWMG